MRKLMFAAGMAIGYVLGSKAGRERYEQICSMARRIRDNPTVHNTATTLKEQAEHMATASKDKIMNSDLGNKLFRDDDLKNPWTRNRSIGRRPASAPPRGLVARVPPCDRNNGRHTEDDADSRRFSPRTARPPPTAMAATHARNDNE